MSILRFEHARREIGTFVILDDVTAAIAHGDRVGLVGVNGAGKTTLLRLAAGADEPDGGKVERKRGLRVGMLAQETNLDEEFTAAPTLRAAVRAGAAETERLERDLAAVEGEGAAAVSSQRYADLRHRFEVLDGYRLDQHVDGALSGLGFEPGQWERPPTGLSGGEQTRAALARLMVADPDLLLLDEPTNHLDVAALEWLELALARRSRALLIASHDRAFLDAVVTRIWEIRDRRLEVFRGSYGAYARQAAERDAQQRKQAQSSQDAAARETELIQNYRSHRNFSKMHEHERRLAAIRQVETPRPGRRMKLPQGGLVGGGPVRSGDVVVSVRDAVVGFPPEPGAVEGTPVLRIPWLEVRRGDRVGIVGPNGAGKTTLLRTVAGELFPLDGVVAIGHGVQLAYLAQLRGAAFPGETVLDALLDRVDLAAGEARGYLARFLFQGDDVFTPVAELSGGERSRLELALLGIAPANLLLLDEPTNHLDIPAREALESFLGESLATLLVVSHDRRLLESICESLWVVEEGSDGQPGAAVAFDGGWREWRSAVASGWTLARALELEQRRLDGRAPSAPRLRAAVGARIDTAAAGDPSAARPARARTVPSGRAAPLSKDAYRRQKEVVDAEMTRLGLRKSHIELALGDPAVRANFVELRRLSSELVDVDRALAAAEDAWLAVEERAPR
ncbi:MAG TPA: ABC-F family ATP-binding cassette domain-containing protein [Candidatus Acidoferrales bacterium]|nr:ABC-F family ATP-binding cassette domain-containing protein [Candidatus Acidoferrales bacterium]